MRLLTWFADNKVAANILALFIIVFGIVSLFDTRKEELPNVTLDTISVSVAYPGASPREIEESICKKIESAIHDIEGVRKLTAVASEGVGAVNVEVASGFDTRLMSEKIKNRIDSIDEFPAEAEKPSIQQVSIKDPVLHIAVYGRIGEAELKDIAERVRTDLIRSNDISYVEVVNNNPFEISIEASEYMLQKYDLTLSDLSAAIAKFSLDIPAGSLETDMGDISIRTQGKAYVGDDFKNIVLRASEDGSRLTIGDVANVVDSIKSDSNILAEFNGQPAIFLAVYRVGNQSILKVSEVVENYINFSDKRLPPSVDIAVWGDSARQFESRVWLLVENAVQGLVLLAILLVFFLRPRFAVWIAFGIPVAFLGAFCLLPYLGGSINMISLFALLLVLGVVVDDSIIVGESIYEQHSKGIFGLRAAKNGVKAVAKPVTIAALTSIATFIPILMLGGSEANLLLSIPIVVICVLLFSLIECLFILPSHLSTIYDLPPKNGPAFLKEYDYDFFRWLDERFYKSALKKAIEWRYVTLAFFMALLLVTVSLLTSSWMKIELFPTIEGDTAVASIRFAQGTPYEVTARAVKKIERAAISLEKTVNEQSQNDDIRNMIAVVGLQPFSDSDLEGAYVGEVAIELAPSEERESSSSEISRMWRQTVGDIPGVLQLDFNANKRDSGPEVQINITGSGSVDELEAATDELIAKMQELSGVYRVTSSNQIGTREINIRLKPSATNLGLDLGQLSAQIRNAYYGEEVQALHRLRDEVKVFVRYPENERDSLYGMENMNVHLDNGTLVPIREVADIDYGFGPKHIKRIDRERLITLNVNVDESLTPLHIIMNTINDDLLPEFKAEYPAINFSVAGLQGEGREVISDLIRGFVIAMLIIYSLIAVLFRSYTQPLMIMMAIPFTIVGVVIGHLILGISFTLWSFAGVVAAGGVVVNDNLVMVDRVNQLKREGLCVVEAISLACTSRFRAILLTTITTFAGLMPLMFEKSVQAQYLIPMAVSLAFGVMFATIITLFFVPVVYYLIADFRGTE